MLSEIGREITPQWPARHRRDYSLQKGVVMARDWNREKHNHAEAQRKTWEELRKAQKEINTVFAGRGTPSLELFDRAEAAAKEHEAVTKAAKEWLEEWKAAGYP